MTRNDIVKSVTKNVLGSINDVNVGFMRFNGDDGGMLYRGIKDLDSTRDDAMAMVDALPASGYTPLAETMYEAALYWRGMHANYSPLLQTDTEALDSKDPMIYRQPTEYACAKNFIVYLTDGEPTRDQDADDLVDGLPDWATTVGHSGCTGGTADGVCLDDIAEYLFKEDINSDVPGDQTVATYTIGFGPEVDAVLLAETARKGGGKYYMAEDVKSLTVALTDIVTNIFDRDISFTAPAVAVNAFNRTQHLNDLYVSVFRASNKVHWPGNIKKYTIADAQIVDKYSNPAVDPDTGYFSDTSHNFWNGGANSDGANVLVGGAANVLPDPATRKVYTNLGAADLSAASNAISTANELAFTLDDFGLAGDPGDPTVRNMIDWIRGSDVRDEDGDPTTTARMSMGDALHAQPASIVYGMTGDQPDIVVYTATNDGFLHAINASTGVELWSFMPHELLEHTGELFFNETVDYKNYGLDGDIVPVVADRNKDGDIDVGTDFIYLIFGMRRGGNNYYALDVTDRNAPKLKWVRTFPQMGLSWSPPVPARVNVTSASVSSPEKVVLILGGGYDTVHDQAIHPAAADVEGAAIFMLDLETGAQVWRAGRDAAADLPLTKMTRAIPARIRVLDLNGDGFADRMYAADLGGQIWRFDIRNGLTPVNLVAGGVIARFGAEGIVSTQRCRDASLLHIPRRVAVSRLQTGPPLPGYQPWQWIPRAPAGQQRRGPLLFLA